jgi:hypothetical protein
MGSAAPRAELGRACCPILIPRGGPGHGGLIRVLPTGSFPQDGTCDLGERCTAGDRYELLGSDGMWTKRGPAKPARGAATLRLADLCLARQTPPAAPDKRAPPGNRLVRGSPGGSGPGSSPCIGGLSPVTGMVVAQPLVCSNHALTVAGLDHISPPPPASAPPTSHPPPPASRPRPSTTSGPPGRDRRPLLGPADRGLGLGGVGLLGQLRAA